MIYADIYHQIEKNIENLETSKQNLHNHNIFYFYLLQMQ